MDPILGQIILWPVPWVPEGWQLCDGTLLNVQQYQALYSLIGAVYGGNGTTTFAVPDLRSQFPMGSTSMSQVNKKGGAVTSSVNAVGAGAATISISNLPSHTHVATFIPSGGGGGGSTTVPVSIPAVSNPAPNMTSATPDPGLSLGISTDINSLADVQMYAKGATTTTLAPFDLTIPGGSGGGTVTNANTGGNTPFAMQVTVPVTVATVPPYVTLNYIIALQGVYPPRP
jgi:microcystin-dependent protein